MLTPEKERAILAQSPSARPRLRLLAFASAIPFLGVVAAFGIAPQTITETVPLERVVQEVLLAPVAVDPPALADRFWREQRIQRGDTLGQLFARLDIDDPDALSWLAANREARAFYQLVPGRTVRAITGINNRLLSFEYRTEKAALAVRRSGDGFVLDDVAPVIERRTALKSGTVQTSLFAAADAAGLPDAIAAQLADVFSSDVDFLRDLRRGDRFSVFYEVETINGEPGRSGRLLAAEFVNQGNVLQAFWFEGGDGRGGYYTADGRNVRKAFLRSPLEFSRVTSGFSSARLHPVLQVWRAHKGIDYGAPTGTPVRATADGTVAMVGTKSGYGKVVILRHAGGFQTLYGHLSGFGNGLAAGARVRQGDTIGFVGATGMATGPHLHYEFHVNGTHVDPLRHATPPGAPITADLKPSFERSASERQGLLELLRSANLAALE
ncbi:MAG: M23 family metallopeptidase [Rhodocyclaceae bacterium]|nr:M23 family metallopeptidase [Rhodocyclaceae bacterium]MCA3145466.1 M23 family metallopeptidase [Rhodocyclaceae bacterium]